MKHRWTREEWGRSQQLYVDAVSEIEIDRGAPPSLNYPGDPPSAEIRDTMVEAFGAFNFDTGEEIYAIRRKDRPDWFSLIDAIVEHRVYETDLGGELINDFEDEVVDRFIDFY